LSEPAAFLVCWAGADEVVEAVEAEPEPAAAVVVEPVTEVVRVPTAVDTADEPGAEAVVPEAVVVELVASLLATRAPP
jgi:hypothetical protein